MARRISRKEPVQKREELLQALREELPELRERHAVRTLGLFGSYARGTPHPRSDLDLLVEFDRVPSLITFIKLEQYLTDRLGVKVDLVMRDSLKPAIGRHILSDLVPV